MVTKRLYLLRHTPAAIAPGICYGRSDLPLATPIAAHATAVRTWLPPALPLFSSPLQRCRQLAEALGEAHCDAQLQELDFGAWELQPYAALPRAALDEWAADPWGFRPPQGETGEEMILRVQCWLEDWLATRDSAIVVSHGGPLRVILGLLLGLPRERWLAQAMPLAGGVQLETREAGGWRVVDRLGATR